MQDRPPGLMARRMFRIDRGRVVIEEDWKIDEPGCPLIQNPWLQNPLQAPGNRYVKQFEMTEEEFRNRKISLFN